MSAVPRPHTPAAEAVTVAAAAPPRIAPAAAVQLLLGRRAPLRMARIRRDLARHPALAGHRLQWHVPPRNQDTPATAARAAGAAAAEGGVVLAIGGDGTINAAAQACWTQGVPMGVVSQGTFNFFSRQQGIAPDLGPAVDQFIQALHAQQLRPIVPGTVNGQVFLVNASLGLYPRLLAEREAATRQFGRSRLVAVLSGLLSLLRAQRGQVLRLVRSDADGREQRLSTLASTLFVGNNALQLQAVGIDGAQEAGRQLVATTLAPRPWQAMLGLLWRAARGRLGEHDAVHSMACTELQVAMHSAAAPGRVRVAFDGERGWMQLPLRFAVETRPLWLVATDRPTPPVG